MSENMYSCNYFSSKRGSIPTIIIDSDKGDIRPRTTFGRYSKKDLNENKALPQVLDRPRVPVLFLGICIESLS